MAFAAPSNVSDPCSRSIHTKWMGVWCSAFISSQPSKSIIGPITVWRKDLREGSGGAGTQRGGLGQVIEIEARDGYDFHFNAMFDRVENAARGRAGGQPGAPGRVELTDGTRLRSKGRQHVGPGQRLRLSLPGGGGYGDPRARPRDEVIADLEAGYITPGDARDIYGQKDEE